MRFAGVSGVVRSRKLHTIVAAKVPVHRTDLINRTFQVNAPNRLWVADSTYVHTTSGFCYTAFVTLPAWMKPCTTRLRPGSKPAII